MYVYAQLEKKEKETNIRRVLKENREKKKKPTLNTSSSKILQCWCYNVQLSGALGATRAVKGCDRSAAASEHSHTTVGKNRTSNVVIVKVRIDTI